MMQTERIFLSLFLFFLFHLSILAQEQDWTNRDIIKYTNEADGYFIYDENFEAAAELYKKLLELNPGDHNISYKLGVCYLNITGKKKKALELLSYASSNYVEDHEYSTLGSAAPFDVLYYLAFALQVNMKLDEAIDYYKKYQNLLRVIETGEIEYINLQIKACRNALLSANTDNKLTKKLFLPWLNNFRDVMNPVVSANDSVFVFTIKKEFKNHIYCAIKHEDIWSEPEDITTKLGRYDDMFTNSLTADGNTMVISRNDGINGDIYITVFKNGSWTKIEKLGKSVNTKYWEAHACISQDGKVLYFSSNKPGGYGSLDLYYAELNDRYKAGEAHNMGPVINTTLEENTPYFDKDSGIIYFSSTGHEGFGGYDVFYSATKNRRWTEPVHLPYPLNTTSDDLNYIPYKKNGLMSMPLSDTSQYTNIYLVSIERETRPETITAIGEISLQDGLEIIPSEISIYLLQSDKDSVLISIKTDSTGSFRTSLSQGNYQIIIKYPGYISDTLSINIPSSFDQEEMYLTESLVPESIASGEFIAIRNILFDFDSFSLNRNAMIEIEKLIPALISHDDLEIFIEGYTDAIGSSNYNLKLSQKRALSVMDYLVESGIEKDRISIEAKGESAFITNNYNDKGTDNPEGRKYNRRVSLNIKSNGYFIPVESYLSVPGHLKKPYSYSYYVVVKESSDQLYPGYFDKFEKSEFIFINEFRVSEKYLYAIGGFRTRIDALTYLIDLRETGFENAYIITEYELPERGKEKPVLPTVYTIQIHALRNRAEGGFKNLEHVREIKGIDGLYRYTVGEYAGYTRASHALKEIRNKGYETAFIKSVELIEKQSIQKTNNDIR